MEEEEWLLMISFEEQIQICASSTHLMCLATEATRSDPKLTFKQAVPHYLHEYQDIFDKKDFDELLPLQPWDHVIELLPDEKTNTSSIARFTLSVEMRRNSS